MHRTSDDQLRAIDHIVARLAMQGNIQALAWPLSVYEGKSRQKGNGFH